FREQLFDVQQVVKAEADVGERGGVVRGHRNPFVVDEPLSPGRGGAERTRAQREGRRSGSARVGFARGRTLIRPFGPPSPGGRRKQVSARYSKPPAPAKCNPCRPA